MQTASNAIERDEVVPFKVEHIYKMSIADKDKLIFSVPHLLEVYEELGSSYTFYEDDKVYACFGIVSLWTGMAEGWFVLADEMKRPVYSICSTLKRYIEELLKEYRRIQTTVKANDAIAVRFIEWLGFEREGLMHNYGADGADYYIYARGTWQHQ